MNRSFDTRGPKIVATRHNFLGVNYAKLRRGKQGTNVRQRMARTQKKNGDASLRRRVYTFSLRSRRVGALRLLFVSSD